MDQTCETAAVAILYNGWLLDQNRITQQAFSDTMDDYDRRWPGAAEREKVFAAAHYVGRHAKTQDLVSRSGAAAVLLWWLFRSGKYKGTNKDWHAERDLIVTFHEHGENKPIKVDLWTSQRSLTEMAADKANSQEIRPINSAAYNIYRNGPQLNEEITWFALGDDVLGVLVRDRIDNDYGGAVLTPDEIGRYRFVDAFHSLSTPDDATLQLHATMRTAAAMNLRPSPF